MTYERILVPLDGSQLSEYVLGHVEQMARAFDSRIVLLHVVDPEESEGRKPTPSQKRAQADITACLKKGSSTLHDKSIASEWIASFGAPAREIVRNLSEFVADLVMMSTHGQGTDDGGPLGSISMAVVSAVVTPAVVVRPSDAVTIT